MVVSWPGRIHPDTQVRDQFTHFTVSVWRDVSVQDVHKRADRSPPHITCGLQNGPQVSGQVFEMLRKLLHDFNVPLTRLVAEVIASAQNSPRWGCKLVSRGERRQGFGGGVLRAPAQLGLRLAGVHDDRGPPDV
jgi:hypothetical protein